MKTITYFIFIFSLICSCSKTQEVKTNLKEVFLEPTENQDNNQRDISTEKETKLSKVAKSIVDATIIYDSTYFVIDYPNGDVPKEVGVCTDVVIRSYRKLGIDLQKEVHEDMKENFSIYPKKWNLKSTDKNIDHRRVPNLMTFFSRKGKILPISKNAEDYKNGNIVCWNLGGAITHIGIVIHQKSSDGKRNLIVHNIGSGQVIEDVLFAYTIIGHYSYKNDE
jgi:uncharacterized protein YijF (DUF1287 family)